MAKSKADTHVQEMSIFIHGILFGLHCLGIAHNIRRHNAFDVLAHSFAAAYDLHAVQHHMMELRTIEGIAT